MKQLTNCYVNISNDDIDIITKSLETPIISGKGPYTELFENELINYFKVPHALTCSNATLGISMILYLLEVREEDEVILPSTAPIMCVLPIIALKAKPIFVDNEENTFNVSIKDLEKKITHKTKLVINVPMWGYANNIEEIQEICISKNIKLLEDNSHCHGTKFKNNYLGSFGDYAIFSTHERKLITTGEGGFIFCKNNEDYLKLKELRSFGEAYSTSKTDLIGSYGLFFGLNFKLSSINSSIGITQLKKLNTKIKIRNTNASYLLKNINPIKKNEIIEIKNVDFSYNNYYALALVANNEDKKNEIEITLKEHNIISDPLRYRYCPLYKLPIVNITDNKCVNAENLIKRIFTVPTHEGLNQEDLNKIIEIINSIYD